MPMKLRKSWAAEEIDRLRDINAELVAAFEASLDYENITHPHEFPYWRAAHPRGAELYDNARAAIAKAKEK